MIWDIRQRFWNDAFPFPIWNSFQNTSTGIIGIGTVGDLCRRLYLVLAASSLSVWCILTASPHRSDQFWISMSKPPFDARYLVYTYSTNDKVSDSSRIDELIASQHQHQQSVGDDDDGSSINVTSYRYDDAEHVDIYNVHEEEYNNAIDDALRHAIERTAKQQQQQQLDDDRNSPDRISRRSPMENNESKRKEE
jgi:Eukaryotic protein of unknown function (DUF829)